MLKFFKISGLLITLFLLQDFRPEKNSLLFEGTLNCKSDAVKIIWGRSALGSKEENLPSLSAARDRLRKAGYSEIGVTKLSEILTTACQPESVRPERGQSGIGQTLANPSHTQARLGSLVLLQNRNHIVTFSVFRDKSGVVKYDAFGHPIFSEPGERVANYARAKGETDCKPISSVCVKCSDGKIICSTPGLK